MTALPSPPGSAPRLPRQFNTGLKDSRRKGQSATESTACLDFSWVGLWIHCKHSTKSPQTFILSEVHLIGTTWIPISIWFQQWIFTAQLNMQLDSMATNQKPLPNPNVCAHHVPYKRAPHIVLTDHCKCTSAVIASPKAISLLSLFSPHHLPMLFFPKCGDMAQSISSRESGHSALLADTRALCELITSLLPLIFPLFYGYGIFFDLHLGFIITLLLPLLLLWISKCKSGWWSGEAKQERDQK